MRPYKLKKEISQKIASLTKKVEDINIDNKTLLLKNIELEAYEDCYFYYKRVFSKECESCRVELVSGSRFCHRCGKEQTKTRENLIKGDKVLILNGEWIEFSFSCYCDFDGYISFVIDINVSQRFITYAKPSDWKIK